MGKTATSLTLKLEEKLFSRVAEENWVCIFDFDGTLAPLHEDPMKVRMSPALRNALKTLQRHAPVWVVTGRALRHVLPMAPRGVPIIAEHGSSSTLKEYRLSGFNLDPVRARLWRKSLRSFLKREDLLGEAWIEPKDYSLAVHYRHAKSPRAFERLLERWVDELPSKDQPVLLPGKSLYNLLPNPCPTKGDAVRWILKRLPRNTRVLYVGDEPTDENAFRVLRGRRHVTLFLGPSRERTVAGYRLPSQVAFERFMGRLVERFSGVAG